MAMVGLGWQWLEVIFRLPAGLQGSKIRKPAQVMK